MPKRPAVQSMLQSSSMPYDKLRIREPFHIRRSPCTRERNRQPALSLSRANDEEIDCRSWVEQLDSKWTASFAGTVDVMTLQKGA